MKQLPKIPKLIIKQKVPVVHFVEWTEESEEKTVSKNTRRLRPILPAPPKDKLREANAPQAAVPVVAAPGVAKKDLQAAGKAEPGVAKAPKCVAMRLWFGRPTHNLTCIISDPQINRTEHLVFN